MFCTKCGKKIDYEASVCNECAGVGQWFNADAQPNPNANNNYSNQGANNNGFYNDQNNAYNQGYNNYNNAYNQGYNNQYDQSYNTTYNQQSTYTPAPEKPKGSRKVGLNVGISAAVFATVGFIMAYVAYIFVEMGYIASYGDEGMIYVFVSAPFAIMGLIFGILGITKGANAINIYKGASPKPIATLILGIEGIASGAGSIMVVVGAMFTSLAVFIEMM